METRRRQIERLSFAEELQHENGNDQTGPGEQHIQSHGPEQQHQSHVETFFGGKLRVYNEINFSSMEANVFVNFCASDILSGDEIFLNVHEIAGEELKNFCAKYQGLGIGHCRLSDSYGMKSVKSIVHCILPRPVVGDELIDLDEMVEFDLVLCYRNALDLSVESGFDSILFTHPLLYADRYGVAKLAISVISCWMEKSPYAEKLQYVSIACPGEEMAKCYMEIVTELANRGMEEFVNSHSSSLSTFLSEAFEADNKYEIDQEMQGTSSSFQQQKVVTEFREYDEALADVQMLEAVFEREYAPLEFVEEQQLPMDGGNVQQPKRKNKRPVPFDDIEDPNNLYASPNLNQFCIEQYGVDELYIREHPNEVYDMLFRSPDGLQLQLSRNLSASILTIEEEGGGMLRQYRMSTQSSEGETLYFRCSRCESMMRYTNDEYRPKITVNDGFIYGDCYPVHHPQCYPVTKEWVILQQLHRQARLHRLQTEMVDGFGGTVENGIETLEANVTVGEGGDSAEAQKFLTGAEPQQKQTQHRMSGAGMKQEMVASGDDQPTTSSARNRLRPAVPISVPMTTRSHSSRVTRQFPISVAAPRFNSLYRNPPVASRRRTGPENATLRAIRKCESELEGRVSDELDRALAAQENMEYWRNPYNHGRAAAAGPFMAPSPLMAVIPRAGRGRRRQFQQQQMAMGHIMELGHEEVVENSEEPAAAEPVAMAEAVQQQQEMEAEKDAGMGTASDQLDRLIDDVAHQQHPQAQQQLQQQPSTSRQWLVGQQRVVVTVHQSKNSQQQQQPAEEVETGQVNKAPRKGIIRKRGGKSDLAFDWREANFDGEKSTTSK